MRLPGEPQSRLHHLYVWYIGPLPFFFFAQVISLVKKKNIYIYNNTEKKKSASNSYEFPGMRSPAIVTSPVLNTLDFSQHQWSIICLQFFLFFFCYCCLHKDCWFPIYFVVVVIASLISYLAHLPLVSQHTTSY